MKRTVDIAQEFGQLKVIATAPPQNNQPACYCRCSACGRTSLLFDKNLLSGSQVHCGCARRRKQREKELHQNERERRKSMRQRQSPEQRKEEQEARLEAKGSLVHSAPRNPPLPEGVFVIATA